MAGETKPPALPGEVWRGKNARGVEIAVTIRGNETEAWFYDFVWQTNTSPFTFRAWALHERAVAAAERALRKAQEEHQHTECNGLAVVKAGDVLRALGVEP